MNPSALSNKGYLVQKENDDLDYLEELSPKERYEKRMKRKKQIIYAAALGIVMCILFAIVKFVIGKISNSLAIESDAVSSLTESYSSIIAVIGILIAHKKPNEKHPNGYGRIEFITAVVGGIFVLVAGWHYFETSLRRVFAPQLSNVTINQLIIIAVTIAGKFYLFLKDKKVGKEYKSSGLITASRNALLSCFSSLLVILSAVVAQTAGIDIDGWIGVIISFFMLATGIIGIKNGMTPLLGAPVKASDAKIISKILLNQYPIVGVYDLRLVNNGAGITRGTVNAEVPGTASAEEVYKAFRIARTEIYRKLGIDITIGLITVNYCEDEVFPAFNEIASEVLKLDGITNIHGFNWDKGNNDVDVHVIVDFDYLNDDQLGDKIQEIIQKHIPGSSVFVDFNVNYLEEPPEKLAAACAVPVNK